MKNNVISLILLACLFCASQTFAQLDNVVTPVNYEKVAEEIYDNYQSGMEIAPDQLTGHLKDLVPEELYAPNCKTTKFVSQSQTATSISLSWEHVENVAGYKVTYLNMDSGASKSVVIDGNKIEFENMPDAMYLFSVVSKCNLGKDGDDGPSSGASIIIMDKPVLLIYDPNQDCPCQRLTSDFNRYRSTYNSGSTFTGTSVTIPWTPVEPMRYFFKIQYDNGTRASILMTSHPNTVSSPPISFIIRCKANLDFGFGVQSNTFLGTGYGSGVSAYLNPSNYEWQILDPYERIFNLRMWRCDDKFGGGNSDDRNHRLSNDNAIQKIFPNPADDYITIELKAPLSSEANLTVVNEMGQIVYRTTLSEATDRVGLNIGSWSTSMYSIRVADEEKILFQESFMKIN